MLYPSVADLIKGEGRCRYSLVIAVAKKARSIANAADEHNEKLTEKPVKLAVQAFADGKASYYEATENDAN